MTMQRCSIDPSDVRAVILECASCGASTGYTVENWKNVPYACSNCSGGDQRDGTARQMYDDLRNAVTALLNVYEQLPFRVRLELDGLSESTSKAKS